MSNIEYLRDLHHKNIEFEKGSILRKEFYSYEEDLVFRSCVKDLIFIYYVHEKSLDFGRFIMPGNKLLLIFIDDLNRLTFCENEA